MIYHLSTFSYLDIIVIDSSSDNVERYVTLTVKIKIASMCLESLPGTDPKFLKYVEN